MVIAFQKTLKTPKVKPNDTEMVTLPSILLVWAKYLEVLLILLSIPKDMNQMCFSECLEELADSESLNQMHPTKKWWRSFDMIQKTHVGLTD